MRRRKRINAVQMVELAYSLALPPKQWLESLGVAARAELDDGAGILAYSYERLTGGGIRMNTPTTIGADASVMKMCANMTELAPPELLRRLFFGGQRFVNFSDLFADDPQTRGFVAENAVGSNLRDGSGVICDDGEGHGLAVVAPLASFRRSSEDERRRWSPVAVHLGAAFRLRARLTQAAGAKAAAGEAVLDATGRCVHAESSAREAHPRALLREAVRATERARTKLRSDPAAAMALWPGLVAGTWSLVDHFDADGRRYIVAHRNRPGLPEPRGLSAREQQVVTYASIGSANKQIAYTLGLSTSTVATHLATAMRKLGLSRRSELVAFHAVAAGPALDLRLADVPLAVAISEPEAPLIGGLTAAENEVARALLRGATNAEVASMRKTSTRTVANQIQAIFRKLGVTSRSELATLLQRRRPT